MDVLILDDRRRFFLADERSIVTVDGSVLEIPPNNGQYLPKKNSSLCCSTHMIQKGEKASTTC